MQISLIMATLGRTSEPVEFVKSLLQSNFDISSVELIIVDQNEHDELERSINLLNTDGKLRIEYLRSSNKALSNARNIGIAVASGEIIAFPDDDCEYYFETLSEVQKAFLNYRDADIILGCVKDKNGLNVLKRWPARACCVYRWNFFFLTTSINVFVRHSVLKGNIFDENMGIGNRFGSDEDTDFVYRSLSNAKAIYCPEIKVYHPSKIKRPHELEGYGLGFGAFCKKNLSLATIFLLSMFSCYHFFRIIQFSLFFRISDARRHYYSLVYRIRGFLIWK